MTRKRIQRAALLAGLPLAFAIGGAPAFAQTAPAPSSNAMINLVRLLVAQGTITKDKGDALIAEATQEAAQAMIAQSAPPQSEKTRLAGDMPPPPPGTIRVPYVPETVRAQITQELKADVLRQAKAEGWAAPGFSVPDWIHDVKLYGDVRIRSQSNFYARDNSDLIPNFQAIVAGGPHDLINNPLPLLNTTRDRINQMRLRARLGADVEIGSKVKLGIELATGNDPSPVSTNSTLGGGFEKRNIYLYKAFVEATPVDGARFDLGRFDNPFLSTDALFDPDLKFDGLAAQLDVGKLLGNDWNVKITGGAFPLDFGDQNFPDTAQTKSSIAQKYLFSGQIEADFSLPRDITLRTAVGYHDFVNLQGRLSDPCPLYTGVTQCSNDGRAPFFVQKGNTLSFMRQIVVDPNATGIPPQPQLLGLTMDYNILDVLASVRVPLRDEIELNVTADYLRNLAFKRSDACRYGLAGEPVNNGAPDTPTHHTSGNICDPIAANRTAYVGGNQGYQVLVSLGYEHPRNWGEWRVFGGYKYLESDAVLDAFTDDDFHLGGTNAKGYILGAAFGLYKGMNVGARWLSANQITGDPLAIDVLQFDLNLAF